MIQNTTDRELGVLGLGEVMLRLSPPGKDRISYSESFEKNAGGSELNVVSGVSMLGVPSGIITKLPKSEITKYVRQKIRYFGANTDYVITDDSPSARLGIYYYENGAYPRPSLVAYDRENSSFSRLKANELPSEIYEKAAILHTSGITLALCDEIRENAVKIINDFSKSGTIISFDVNFREALWSEDMARAKITAILPFVNILFISEETAKRTFKMEGSLCDIQEKLSKSYPNLEIIASTKRKATSPSKHSFSSLVFDCKERIFYEEEPYIDIDVVDRVGSGDAYVAGALFGLLKHRSIEKMAKYGNAMAAMKSTVSGDVAKCDLYDIERIIKRHSNTSQNSEMVR